MGKFEDASELRIEAEELFRKAGNSIRAEEVLAWMNIEAIPTLKKIEKPKSSPVEKLSEACYCAGSSSSYTNIACYC